MSSSSALFNLVLLEARGMRVEKAPFAKDQRLRGNPSYSDSTEAPELR